MPAPVAFAAASNIDPEAFERQLGRAVDPTGYPYAVAVESGIPVYDGASLRQLLLEEGQRGGLKSELVSVLAGWSLADWRYWWVYTSNQDR